MDLELEMNEGMFFVYKDNTLFKTLSWVETNIHLYFICLFFMVGPLRCFAIMLHFVMTGPLSPMNLWSREI